MKNYVSKLILSFFFFINLLAGEETIKLGGTGPESFNEGVKLYIDKINATGGIQGKKIDLTLLADKDDPLLVAENLHRLITEEKVIAILADNFMASLLVALPIAFRKITYSPVFRLAYKEIEIIMVSDRIYVFKRINDGLLFWWGSRIL